MSKETTHEQKQVTKARLRSVCKSCDLERDSIKKALMRVRVLSNSAALSNEECTRGGGDIIKANKVRADVSGAWLITLRASAYNVLE